MPDPKPLHSSFFVRFPFTGGSSGRPREGAKGFTLVQISILLTVASLVLVTLLPSIQSQTANNAVTAMRMTTVLAALRQFESANNRLPCPADASLPAGSANFGVEANNNGTTSDCMGGAISANYADATNHIATGMIPVKALGLSNAYALDGFGRLITYAVDTAATANCAWAGTNGTLTGHLAVMDNGTPTSAPVALVSHGANGHGAWVPLTGSSGLGNRLNAGSADADELTNAHVDSLFVPTMPLTGFVRKQPTSTFDDVVEYQNPSWNLAKQPAASPVCVYERSLTINHANVSGGLTSFPVLVSLTDASLKNFGSGGHVASSNGNDILFTSDLARSQPLNWEIESYNGTTGALVAWVNIPALSNSADTVFYVNYGNYRITSAQSVGSSVWDAGYRGVWHFPNASTLSVSDSSANGNNGTVYGAVAAGGVIGGGVNVPSPGGQYVTVPNQTFAGDFTLEGWANLLISHYCNGNGASTFGPAPSINAYCNQWRLWDASSDIAISPVTVATGTWHHIVVTRAGSGITLYQDGAVVASGSSGVTYSFPAIANNNATESGSNYGYDEIRSSAVARSASWIATQYNNQSAPSSFLSWGSETIVSR